MNTSRIVFVALLLVTPTAAWTHHEGKSTMVWGALPASPCRARDAATTAHLHYLRALAISSSNAAAGWRASVHVPAVSDTANRIVVVSDSAQCTAALIAFNTTAQLTDSSATEIELIQADTVFVASHPAIMSGEFVMRYVFDRGFHYLGSYLK